MTAGDEIKSNRTAAGQGKAGMANGNSEAMTSRKTSLEAVEPELDKQRLQHSVDTRPHKEIRLGRETQGRIGELLRSMYNSYVDQGVPEQLEDLVRRLGEQE
ncbi:MAG: NepR family anti-sigma factor [Xanthobacteraceae bacterium]